MKKLKAIVSASVLLTLVLASCASENPTVAPTTLSGTTSVIATTEDNSYKPPAGIDYGGYLMRILTLTMGENDWKYPVMDTEETNAEPVNDAIYKRNRSIEAALNVKIKEIANDSANTLITKSVRSNSDDYDLIFYYSHQMGSPMSSGVFLDLKQVYSLNLGEPYWNQLAIESFELMDKLFYVPSDASVMVSDALWVIYFNKKLAENMSIDFPYKLVRDGKWTVDAMYDMCKQAALDLDGDGVYGAKDQWGATSHTLAFTEFMTSQNALIVVKDENGYPVTATPDDRFVNAFLNAKKLMDPRGGIFLDVTTNFQDKNSDEDHATKIFMRDKALFCTEVLGHMRTFREMTADYGLLPHPKYDENQPIYYNGSADTVPSVAIPASAIDPERTGTFLDALTGASADTTMPAYYIISFEGKFSRDEESMEMLDIILQGRIYDLGVIYNWGELPAKIRDYGTKEGNDNPATVYDKYGDRVTSLIEKTMAKVLEA
ncbi:hypothetical protein FACS1894105_02460 [Clostridia bacterium]|nr:hypothetical protein FACS1894105_02250 [Clostridia bacterium]GHU34870.1 hypothetical protein FACS1894105_02460 [Clostridia bacterium]